MDRVFLFLLVLAPSIVNGIRPKHSWDTLSSMSFIHLCNETGLFSDRAMDTIAKFPLVTIEKGQGFNDTNCSQYGPGVKFPCAEEKIVEQCKAIKERDPTIATVFYYNAVLSWYFYNMDVVMQSTPAYQLKDSYSGKAVHAPGDRHFDPPAAGMLVFDHSKQEARQYWISACINATKSGYVDGCFSDSSSVDTHKTAAHLNDADHAAFEFGKVQSMTELTEFFGGHAGEPYDGSDGVLIAKYPNQSGINAVQIEFFTPDEAGIAELMDGVSRGYLMQAHAGVDDAASIAGCNNLPRMTTLVAAFLIAAGDNSYFGTGPWISPGIDDVEQRWCAQLFDRPIGKPLGNATKQAGTSLWTRSFASGTNVTLDTRAEVGTIIWGGKIE